MNPYEIIYGYNDDVEYVKQFVECILYTKCQKRFEIKLRFGPMPEDDMLAEDDIYTKDDKTISGLTVTIRPGLQLHEVMGVYAHKVAPLVINDMDIVMSPDTRTQNRNYVFYYQFAYDVVYQWDSDIAQHERHRGMLQSAKAQCSAWL